MDVYLIDLGIVVNVASVESMEQALELYPDLIVVERNETNDYLNPGDNYA